MKNLGFLNFPCVIIRYELKDDEGGDILFVYYFIVIKLLDPTYIRIVLLEIAKHILDR